MHFFKVGNAQVYWLCASKCINDCSCEPSNTVSVQPTPRQIKETCSDSDCQYGACCIVVTTSVAYSYLISSQPTNVSFISQPQTITDIITTNIILSNSESTHSTSNIIDQRPITRSPIDNVSGNNISTIIIISVTVLILSLILILIIVLSIVIIVKRCHYSKPGKWLIIIQVKYTASILRTSLI